MPAFVIVEITVEDAAAYEEYKQLTPASIAAYGGRFVVSGGASEALEGDWQPQRMVVLEFKDVATAKQWWASEAYAAAKSIRQRAAQTRMLVVEGYE